MRQDTKEFALELASGDLKTAALLIISTIKQNTNQGIDRFGRPFQPYSRKPFGMPLAAFLEKTTKRQRKALNKEGDIEIYQNKKTGSRWVIIDGGYFNFKSKWSPKKASVVNLQWSGLMLKSLQVDNVTENSAEIVFSSADKAQLAYYHSISGAGKSRVKREFMGVTKEQEQKVADFIASKVKLTLKIKGLT
jgi:hypothetical protein